jgi:hypothetical protein
MVVSTWKRDDEEAEVFDNTDHFVAWNFKRSDFAARNRDGGIRFNSAEEVEDALAELGWQKK